MRHAALAAAALLAAFPMAAQAQKARPATAAELARSVDIPYEEFTLDNGLRVVVHTDLNSLYERPDDYWTTIGDRYRSITAAQMDSAIRDSVDTGRWVWVVVGDAAVVRPQLEALGLPIEERAAGE